MGAIAAAAPCLVFACNVGSFPQSFSSFTSLCTTRTCWPRASTFWAGHQPVARLTHRQATIHTHIYSYGQTRVASSSSLHVFGLGEETQQGTKRPTPNSQLPSRSSALNPQPACSDAALSHRAQCSLYSNSNPDQSPPYRLITKDFLFDSSHIRNANSLLEQSGTRKPLTCSEVQNQAALFPFFVFLFFSLSIPLHSSPHFFFISSSSIPVLPYTFL